MAWIAFWASQLAIFRVLEYAGKLTVLVAVVVWMSEIPERHRAKVRTAWSVVNSKGGGRLEALDFLAQEKVDLRSLNGEYGYFGGIHLSGKDLTWADLSNANFDDANLRGANLQGAKLDGATFRGADLRGANLSYVSMSSAPPTQFRGAKLSGADFRGVSYPSLGAAYWAKSIASASDWQEARFDTNDLKLIQQYATKVNK